MTVKEEGGGNNLMAINASQVFAMHEMLVTF